MATAKMGNTAVIFGRPFVKRFALCYQTSPIFGPCLLWPNGWMDQDGTWHGGGPWSRPHSARWGTSSPPPKRGQRPPIFGPFLLSPNDWMNQNGSWYGGRPQPRGLCVRCEPSFRSPKGAQSPQIFGQCPLWLNDWMD